MNEPIKVEGLRELRRGLRQLGKEHPKAIKNAGNKAAEIIVEEAKPRVPVVSGKAKSTVKVASTTTAARVQAGSKKVPYYAWLDFGGRVGRGRSVKRPFLKSGRYIWAAYADKLDIIEETLSQELEAVIKEAGLG